MQVVESESTCFVSVVLRRYTDKFNMYTFDEKIRSFVTALASELDMR